MIEARADVSPDYLKDLALEQEVDHLLGAYESLGQGIHGAVQRAAGTDGQLPAIYHGYYVQNFDGVKGLEGLSFGEACESYSEAGRFLEAATDSFEPDYVREYKFTRAKVFKGQLDGALATGNFRFFFGTIQNLKDPMMAQTLLNILSESQEPNAYYDYWGRPKLRFKREIENPSAHPSDTRFNYNTATLKEALKQHARDKRDSDLRKRIAETKTGLLRAVMIGVQHSADLGVKKYLKRELKMLKEIAKLPRVEQQMLDKEIAALPLSDS